MATVSDSFTGTGELGSNWQSGGVGHGFVRSSDQCVYRSGARGISWTANAFTTGDTQFAQVKIVQLASQDYCPGPSIRLNLNDWALDSSGYNASVAANGMIRLYRTGTGIVKDSAAGAITAGQTLKIVDEGSGNIRVYVDGTMVTSGGFSTQYTDGSPLTGDYIGLYSYAVNGTAPTFIIDDFAGGDGTGAGASAVANMANYFARLRA